MRRRLLYTCATASYSSHHLRLHATRPLSTASPGASPIDNQGWSHPPTTARVKESEINRLAAAPRRPVTLADLVRHGRPPLSEEALLASANYTLSLLPARLAHRVISLRNLPFIVVANPHISKIYNNYLHSLSTLEPFYRRPIATLKEEEQFTEVMADLVQTHANTIPTLAQGFLECKKYTTSAEVTRFLDQHLRARIGTRLVAEQHIALHMASTTEARRQSGPLHHIGVIDTALQPAAVIRSCENWVGEICELKYGVRPRVVIDGDVSAEFAHVPVHLEYILTELLKNSFRATVESGRENMPIEVTIASASNTPRSKLEALRKIQFHEEHNHDFTREGLHEYCTDFEDNLGPMTTDAQHITIRIRDSGGGIPPDVLPNIWAYSFTTFNADEAATALRSEGASTVDGLDALTNGGNPSSIAGLGYGLPLGRAYAEYFGGSIKIQSMYKWGTDVYLELQGLGKVG